MIKKISFITEKMLVGHGVELVIDKLASGLTEKGYECNVFCTQIDNEYKKRACYDIILIPRIHGSGVLDLEKKTKELRHIFNNQDSDLFIINTFPYYSLAGVLDKPVFSINYGVISTEGMDLRRRLFFKYMDFTQNNFYFKNSRRIISISEFLNSKIPKALKNKSSCIYLGADHYIKDSGTKDEIAEHALSLRQKLKVSETDILMLYAGRLNPVNQPYKGTRELIDIFKEAKKSNNSLKLLMVGFGSKNDEIALRNEGVCVIPNAPFEMMPVIYSACDIYTTCTKWEGFDLPVVEAQTFSKPSICYNIGAHPEIMEDGITGYLANSREEFFSRLIELSRNEELIKEMGENGFRSSKKFAWERTVAEYDTLIKGTFNLASGGIPEGTYNLIPGNLESSDKEFADDKTIFTNTSALAYKDSLQNRCPNETEIIPGAGIGANGARLQVPVTVLIVNYNSSFECISECLDSLKKQSFKDFRVILFDNGSTNDSMSAIKEKYLKENDKTSENNNIDKPEDSNSYSLDLQIIGKNSNIGLGKAINEALKMVNTKYVLISSFDVVYDAGAIEELVKEAENSDDDVVGLAPKIKFSYQRNFIESVGTYLDTSLYDGYQGLGQLDLHQYDITEEIFGLSFTSAFIKTSYFKTSRVGPVEENFYLFYEDFDFCYRANLLGYKFSSCPKCIVYHKYAYNFREESTAFQTIYYYKRLNLLKMLLKNCEQRTIDRILPVEIRIMKKNLKDRNMKHAAKKILSDFSKSRSQLLKQRKMVQLQRLVNDDEIIKYYWGEKNFFDIITNEPIFSIDNLIKTYQRLFVITGSNKYMEYVSYLKSLEDTKLKFDKKILSSKLHNKFENEPISVHEFIDRI